MNKYAFLIPVGIVLGLGGFVAFWCLIVKLLSLVGWGRLAQYQVPASQAGAGSWLGWVTLGGVRYQNIITAHARAEGLALEALFLFRIGHPPLLIPWSALEPVVTEKNFWGSTYTTNIRTDSGSSVAFSFSNDRLATDLRLRLGATSL